MQADGNRVLTGEDDQQAAGPHDRGRETMDVHVNRITDLIQCMRVRPLLQSYLDGELDDEQGAAMVARHLEACRRCGLAADSITKLKRQVARFRREPTQEDIERVARVIEELTEDAERREP